MCVCVYRGHDFRKAFSQIDKCSITASAATNILEEVTSSLHMSSSVIVSCDLDSPNSFLSSSEIKAMNVSKTVLSGL